MNNTQEQNNKVLVGMSGGVDSSVAACLLMRQGYAVSGATLRLHDGEEPEAGQPKTCCSLQDVEDARSVCDRLGIRHYVFNFKEYFSEQVIEKFIQSYLQGGTPNPCIDCNRYIKFSKMLERAQLLDMQYVATGHYARIEHDGEKFSLKKAKDESKDQTYVLYTLTQEQLEHTLMPLGGLTKPEVRELAVSYGFVNAAKPDSQDICFVPDGKYAAFIERKMGKPYPAGDFVDAGGTVLGQHAGVIRYTIGQRKGLGQGFGKPMYVVDKQAASNRVVLGDEPALFGRRVRINDLNFIPFDRLEQPLRCFGKLRYRQHEEACRIVQTDADTLIAEFDSPQRAATPGQAAVFYDGDTVIGGGTIAGVCDDE